MHTRPKFHGSILILITAACASWAGDPSPEPDNRLRQDKIAIERLHQEDIAATLTDNAHKLAKLWDDNAVRLQANALPEISKTVIYADDKRWQANLHGGRTLSYKPDIKDLQIVDGWAFEWDTFEVVYKESEQAKPVTIHGKALRVLKRQPDGAWKFARVMAVTDSSAPKS
jgi:ketosteroid isomerase-like protein